LGGPGHRVDEQHDAGGHRGRTDHVEVAVVLLAAALIEHERSCGDDRDPHGHVDEKDPRPSQVRGQKAAQEHAGGTAATRGRAPDAECAVALGALGERGHQDRQRCGREQRTAQALERAEADQRALGPRNSAQEGADREQGQADHEQAPAAEDVRQPPAQEQGAAEQDRVRADDPLQVVLGEVEVALDRRQRDVHDRDVEHDHELGGHDHRQREALAAILPGCD
jgi:hypothetical protein